REASAPLVPLGVGVAPPEQPPEQAADGAERGAGRDAAGRRRTAAIAAPREIAADFFGEVDDRHALQPDMAGAGQRREEQAFAAEQYVLEALHHLNVESDAGLEHADMAGMDQQALARRKIAL